MMLSLHTHTHTNTLALVPPLRPSRTQREAENTTSERSPEQRDWLTTACRTNGRERGWRPATSTFNTLKPLCSSHLPTSHSLFPPFIFLHVSHKNTSYLSTLHAHTYTRTHMYTHTHLAGCNIQIWVVSYSSKWLEESHLNGCTSPLPHVHSIHAAWFEYIKQQSLTSRISCCKWVLLKMCVKVHDEMNILYILRNVSSVWMNIQDILHTPIWVCRRDILEDQYCFWLRQNTFNT